MGVSGSEENKMNYRLKPRKSKNPCRAPMGSIQDEIRFRPLRPTIKIIQPCSMKRKNLVGLPISLPSIYDDDHQQQPPKRSSERQQREVKVDRARKIKTIMKREVKNLDDDQVIPEKFKHYIRELGVTEDPVLVIKKELYKSDVNPNLGRLSIPEKQVLHEFLTEEERKKFNIKNKNEEIEATLIEPSLAERKIKFKKWYMNSAMYILMNTWNEVVKTNELKIGTPVQLWSFKKGSELYFVLVRL